MISGDQLFILFILVLWINEVLFWIIYVDHGSVSLHTKGRVRVLMLWTHLLPFVAEIIVLVTLEVPTDSCWWILLACMRLLTDAALLSMLIVRNRIY